MYGALFRLFELKKDLAQVAAVRGLKETTLISHLCQVLYSLYVGVEFLFSNRVICANYIIRYRRSSG